MDRTGQRRLAVAAVVAAATLSAAYVAGRRVTTPQPVVHAEELAEPGDEFIGLLGLQVHVRRSGHVLR